ncbi:hypothetical protein BDQ17DRAFT_398346 [Cyathus striatus]|nr:hypothetical protein BDQ17DRAFT_398346 [Cyathus striatus]
MRNRRYPISNGRHGKKRGMDHKCESCSKIYRHPSCLIKHRWEHTPHWREASKFVLSKHQQVQLLEAAAILSHLSPSASGGRSLPEDRSLWPSFLSGGSLPPPEPPVPVGTATVSALTSSTEVEKQEYPTYPVSSSVPSGTAAAGFKRSTSAGPRLHDYSVPISAGSVSAVRPGVLGVPTTSVGANVNVNLPPAGGIVIPTAPMAVPTPTSGGRDIFNGYRSPGSFASSSGVPGSGSYAGAQGWSLPRSSIRSGSRSRSTSRSEDDDGSFDGEVGVSSYAYGRWKREEDDECGFSMREEDEDEEARGVKGVVVDKIKVRSGREDDEEWDGMEMEMDMD